MQLVTAILEDYQQAVEFYLKAFALNPSYLTVSNLNHEFGFTYVQMGEFQKAREVFEKMIAGKDEIKAQGIPVPGITVQCIPVNFLRQ